MGIFETFLESDDRMFRLRESKEKKLCFIPTCGCRSVEAIDGDLELLTALLATFAGSGIPPHSQTESTFDTPSVKDPPRLPAICYLRG